VNAAFLAVFGVFLLLMVGLAFTAIRWGVRRDRAARNTDPGPDGTGPGGEA
jgi:hypothetical protein